MKSFSFVDSDDDDDDSLEVYRRRFRTSIVLCLAYICLWLMSNVYFCFRIYKLGLPILIREGRV